MAKNLIAGTTTTIVESGNDISVDLNTNYKDYCDSVGYVASLNTTDKTSVVNAINELYSDMYFQPGDSLTATYQVGGYVTTGTKEFWCTIYVPKSLKYINTITVSSGTFMIRIASGGYLDNNTSGISYNASGFSLTLAKITDTAITLKFAKSSAFSGTTNNTPAAGYISTLTLNFS